MTRYGSGSSLWPEQSARSRRVWTLKRTLQVVVGVAVSLIAAHSLIDMVAPEPGAVGTEKVATSGAGAARNNAKLALAGTSQPVRNGADNVTQTERTAEQVPAPTEANAPAEATRKSETTPARAAAAADETARPQEVVRAPTAQPAAPTPPRKQVSDRDLTFKQGYAQRQAALGRAPAPAAAPAPAPAADAANAPHPARKKVAQAQAQAKSKPHKQRAPMQAYQLPDGRMVMVRRGYRSSPDARVAEMRSERFGFGQGFGEPFGQRRGIFGGFY